MVNGLPNTGSTGHDLIRVSAQETIHGGHQLGAAAPFGRGRFLAPAEPWRARRVTPSGRAVLVVRHLLVAVVAFAEPRRLHEIMIAPV